MGPPTAKDLAPASEICCTSYSETMAMERTATTHPVDIKVGKHIRLRRQELSMSQTDLAKKLGLTFQQVQKYERGTNRVSCSRLSEISEVLDAPITFFFSEAG